MVHGQARGATRARRYTSSVCGFSGRVEKLRVLIYQSLKMKCIKKGQSPLPKLGAAHAARLLSMQCHHEAFPKGESEERHSMGGSARIPPLSTALSEALGDVPVHREATDMAAVPQGEEQQTPCHLLVSAVLAQE